MVRPNVGVGLNGEVLSAETHKMNKKHARGRRSPIALMALTAMLWELAAGDPSVHP